MKERHEVIIGLGSDIADRSNYLDLAIEELERVFDSKVISSKKYESEAWGFKSENKFLNCCIILQTYLSPEAVLIEIKAIEKRLGRVKKSKNGAYQSRVIDIDILYMDDLILESQNLTIPHPLIYDRSFVLRPLADVCPSFIDPVKKVSVLELLALCNDENEVILYGD